jgi:hypothetical protein
VYVSLYRGKLRVRRLASGTRRAGVTYKIRVSPRRLRKGATYTLRLFVRTSDGERTERARVSAKRL